MTEISLLPDPDRSDTAAEAGDAESSEAERAKIHGAICTPGTAAFSFALPPGRYMRRGNAIDMEDRYQELTLSGEQPCVELGAIDMKLAPMARLYVHGASINCVGVNL